VVDFLGVEIATNFFLEIRRGYDRTNRIKEISKVEDNA
jgi:hypothetical protein